MTSRLLKIAFILVIASVTGNLAHAACPGRTTSEKVNCLVVKSFADKHLAATITNAKTKDIVLARSSTFLPETEATLNALRAAVESTRSEKSRLDTFYCVYVPAKPAQERTATKPATREVAATATCSSVKQDLYFCANNYTPKKVKHLDSNPIATCN